MEREAYAIAAMVEKMGSRRLDPAPIWTDVRTFDGRPWGPVVDTLVAGYPCQPFSAAGRRVGEADPRHLWPEVRRIISETNPSLCVFENVSAHLHCGGDRVLRDLQDMGYRTAADLHTASEVGAPHRRERLFIVAANSDGLRKLQPEGCFSYERGRAGHCGAQRNPWVAEPTVGRVADGVANRVDRMRLLGNGVVPAQAGAAIVTCLEALLEEHVVDE